MAHIFHVNPNNIIVRPNLYLNSFGNCFERISEKIFPQNNVVSTHKQPWMSQISFWHYIYTSFQHWYRLSYQHYYNVKLFAWVVYINLTFTCRSSVTFPPSTAETELLAVLPTWQGSVASPGPLAVQLSPTGWESGRVDGSAAWLLATSLPSWPSERAWMGSPVSQCIDRGPALH